MSKQTLSKIKNLGDLVDGRLIRTLTSFFVRRGDPPIAYISTANVSNPPTDAQLDSTFGTPSNLGEGSIFCINDNNLSTTYWICMPVGGKWIYWQASIAV